MGHKMFSDIDTVRELSIIIYMIILNFGEVWNLSFSFGEKKYQTGEVMLSFYIYVIRNLFRKTLCLNLDP